jgi:hypothetical protein
MINAVSLTRVAFARAFFRVLACSGHTRGLLSEEQRLRSLAVIRVHPTRSAHVTSSIRLQNWVIFERMQRTTESLLRPPWHTLRFASLAVWVFQFAP